MNTDEKITVGFGCFIASLLFVILFSVWKSARHQRACHEAGGFIHQGICVKDSRYEKLSPSKTQKQPSEEG